MILEHAIRDLLQKPDGNVTEAELLKITVLGGVEGNGGTFGDIKGEITTLSDLKWLKNLTTLSLGDCEKIDLSPVSGMRKLKELYAPYSNITDISMLADKVDLEYLQLSDNNISDISSLKGLIDLAYLNISLNNISNIDILDGLPNLETVDIDDNPIPEEKMAAFYAPKEQDFFTREFQQHLGDTDCIFVLLAFKSKESGRYQTTKITIKNAETGTVIQEIIPSTYTYFNDNPSYFNDDLGFVVEDMNFDGYDDIRIVEFLPAGPNIPYACWVWDKNIGKYVYNPELSAIASLEVDYENKLIYSFGRASASEHFEEYYRYIGDTLMLIKEVRTGSLDESDPYQGYLITYELIDGEWIMTEKEKTKLGG